MRDEVEELRKTRRSEIELCEEGYQDASSQYGDNILDTVIRECEQAHAANSSSARSF